MTAKLSSWYDKEFDERPAYHVPYSKSEYFPMWQKVLDYTYTGEAILDIGCGPGQFAQMCVDFGRRYVGVDFSEEALRRARELNPGVTFIKKDLELLEPLEISYNQIGIVMFLEVLEHVERDIEILDLYADDRLCVLTLPNFMYESHVRCYKTEDEIRNRYPKFTFVEINKLEDKFICLAHRELSLIAHR